MSNHEVLSDVYVNKLFENTDFGEEINDSVDEKRKKIAEIIQDQVNGNLVDSISYKIVVDGGFVKAGDTEKEVTALGNAFLQDVL